MESKQTIDDRIKGAKGINCDMEHCRAAEILQPLFKSDCPNYSANDKYCKIRKKYYDMGQKPFYLP